LEFEPVESTDETSTFMNELISFLHGEIAPLRNLVFLDQRSDGNKRRVVLEVNSHVAVSERSDLKIRTISEAISLEKGRLLL